MADVKFKGYVNRPQTRTGSKGTFSSYSVSEKIKDPKTEKGFRYAFYQVTDFNAPEPPAEGAFVTIVGWLKPREYETNGQKRLSLDVIAQAVEVAPPRDGGARPAAAADAAPATEEDPFGDI